jgi:hypothetical protein
MLVIVFGRLAPGARSPQAGTTVLDTGMAGRLSLTGSRVWEGPCCTSPRRWSTPTGYDQASAVGCTPRSWGRPCAGPNHGGDRCGVVIMVPSPSLILAPTLSPWACAATGWPALFLTARLAKCRYHHRTPRHPNSPSSARLGPNCPCRWVELGVLWMPRSLQTQPWSVGDQFQVFLAAGHGHRHTG